MSRPLVIVNLFFAAVYFAVMSSLSALVGQHVVRRVINVLGRASIIIFILAFTIFVSAISLGMFSFMHYVSDHFLPMKWIRVSFYFPPYD